MQLRTFQVCYGLPDVSALNLVGKKVHSLLILDDLANLAYGSPAIAHIFSNVSNHDQISIIIVTQNAFPKVQTLMNIFTSSS